MNFLLKKNQFSKYMTPCSMRNEDWLRMLREPPVIPDKTKAPLAIYGTMSENPESVNIHGKVYPRCTGENLATLRALQLDFDSGVTIDQFCQQYEKIQFTLYTSYSYGFKPCDRFRVIIPLASPMPCYLLTNRRVKNNIVWHFPGIDECAADRGHWQILPCVRAKGAPYKYYQNKGSLWGGEDYWRDYARWVEEDKLEFARRAERAKELTREVNVDELLIELEGELNAIPVGQGQRYAAVKRLLAKYVHKGVGEAILSVPCPWSDKKWERQWPGLVNWASTIV